MTHKALRIIPSVKSEDWKEILSDLLTDPEELLNILRLDISKKPPSLSALTQFPLKVPRPFVDAMERENWSDPLLLQIWPSKEEEMTPSSFSKDPLQEYKFNPVTGLLHKYQAKCYLRLRLIVQSTADIVLEGTLIICPTPPVGKIGETL